MDDDDIALADSFINFELAASSPTYDYPPDPIINESGCSDPDLPVGSCGIEERIGSLGLVEKEVNRNESGVIRGEVIANDDDAVGVESEDGEVRGQIEIVAVDDVVGMESEEGEIKGNVIANDDEIGGGVIANDDKIRVEIDANDDEIRGKIMGVDNVVGMESEECEIKGDVIAYDGEVRGEIVANDDEVGGKIMGVEGAVGMESEEGEIRGDVVTFDDEIRGEIVVTDDVDATVSEGSDRESECSGSGIKIDEDYELEEGEIVESDNDRKYCSDDSDDSDDEESQERSVRLTNGLEILPRVPPVNVNLGPHHILLPLGVVTSIVGVRVVVEGSEKHDPLDQGSVLWITGRQTPLGVIDDTFAQVKNPHYIVRYNSEDEIPKGVCEGTLISFVAEFAQHVLHSKELYKKGSDASGMYDEEVSGETEFSDDEQEAEYNRIQKQAKRGQRSQNSDRMKNDRQHVPLNDGSIPKRQMVAHGQGPPIPSSGQGFFGVGRRHSSPLPGTGQGFSGVGRGHSNPLPGTGQGFSGVGRGHSSPLPGNGQGFFGVGRGHSSPLPGTGQSFPGVGRGHSSPLPGTGQGFSGVGHGHSSPLPPLLALTHQPPVSRNWPSGFPTNSVARYPENTQNQQTQGIPLQQQFNPSQRFPPPTVYPGGQPNMHAQGPMNQNQQTHFPQFQAPSYFQPVNISGNLAGPPRQFNPPTYFHSPPIAANQGGPQHQFSPPANPQSQPISGYQSGPQHQFNPPANFQSPPIAANQNPPQFNQQFNPGAYDGRERTSGAHDGRERTFAGHGRRPSRRGGKGWRPAK